MLNQTSPRRFGCSRIRASARIVSVAFVLALTAACGDSANSAPESAPPSGGNDRVPLSSLRDKQMVTTGSSSIPKAPAQGACVSLSGTPSRAELSEAKCDDASANYVVVQVTKDPRSCVADADYKYFRLTTSEEWSACLDYNWTASRCIDFGEPIARNVDCTPGRRATYRATDISVGASDKGSCAAAVVHSVRRFAVCTQPA